MPLDLEQQLRETLPTAARLLAIVIGGVLASALARRAARWLVDKSGLDALAEKAGAARLLYAIGVRQGVSRVVGSLVWVAGLLATGAAAAEVLGLEAVATGAATLISYLPRLAAAALVLGVGAGLANLLRRAAVGFAQRRGDVDNPDLLGNLAYYGTMTLAVIVACDQAGLDTALVQTILVTLAAISAAAIALAFALGSRYSFHNLVAGHFLSRLVRPGDTIRVGTVEGVVVRYFGVCVVVRTEAGEVAIPCKVLLEQDIGLSRLGAKARASRDEQAP